MIFNHEDYRKEQTFHTDVVVVGTGAGGAVAGAELAEEGLDVLFVEEGAYHPTSSFNPYLTESIPRLYRDVSATMIHGNPVIPYVEGRALGGSTVINGGMTWRTPEKVLDQWEKVTGDSSLGPKGLESLFQEIEKSIQSNYHDKSSFGESNRIMLEGAKKMGWKVETNRRNQNHCVGTNSCGLGCPTGAKQSTLVSHIPRAMSAGARCLTEVRIEKLIVEKGRCAGVIGRAIDPVTRKANKKVTIRARAVVIACGGIQTPHLLLKQKPAKKNRHLGQHFSCHPNAKVAAIYPHDVRAWKGVSQWTQIREFHEEGIVMAENMITPGALAAFIPWHGKKAMALLERYNNIILSGVLVEDSTTGSVRPGLFDLPVAKYDITPYDHERFKKGARLLAQMHFEMGAEGVILPFVDLPYISSIDDLKKIEETQVSPKTLELFTVHLMGTARMGREKNESVVDVNGEFWDLPGCYISDASIFPTPIGVNPQVTIMALATRIGRRLAEKLILTGNKNDELPPGDSASLFSTGTRNETLSVAGGGN